MDTLLTMISLVPRLVKVHVLPAQLPPQLNVRAVWLAIPIQVPHRLVLLLPLALEESAQCAHSDTP